MRWKLRALALHALDRLPGGQWVYQLLQQHLGEFRRGEFLELRLRKQCELARVCLENGGRLEGARIVEVGTGWVPLVPLGFWICGAARITTFDLNPYLHEKLFAGALRFLGAHQERLTPLWQGLAPTAQVRERLALAASCAGRPRELLALAGIDYRAPADAAATGLPDASVDLHYSANVLEHVPPEAIVAILGEARRLLAPGGLAVHHADPSDHFAHTDPAISRIHFLRFEDRAWARWSHNRYAYLNRLHDSDYRCLFTVSGLDLLDCRSVLDTRLLALLEGGLSLASPFCHKPLEELARGNLTYVARAGGGVSIA